MAMNYITSTRNNKNVSVILYGSNHINRMTLIGPPPLFKIGPASLLDAQLCLLKPLFSNADIFIHGGDKNVVKLSEEKCKVVIGERNECVDLYNNIFLLNYKNVLLCRQNVLPLKVNCNINQSTIFINTSHYQEVCWSPTFSKLVLDDTGYFWTNILFLHEKDLPIIKRTFSQKDYTNKFLFEFINDAIENGLKLQMTNCQAITINSHKDLQLINENINF